MGGMRSRFVKKILQLGGKCGYFEKDGYQFDTGPSLLTMPFVLEELFSSIDRRLEHYLSLEQVEEPAYRYFFSRW